MDLLPSLSRDISPPLASKKRKVLKISLKDNPPALQTNSHYDTNNDPALAAVEAGRAKIEDHLTYFKHHLAKASKDITVEGPRLSIGEFAALYRNNQHRHGHHFVVHQHNHPRAGVHYDLRLQFSATSSVSWALPKGLPGNPNSRQLGRMAIETRVHTLWNNLIESASMKTGSLLIWDTGTYTVLPRQKDELELPSPQTTDDESDVDEGMTTKARDGKHENEKLFESFRSRHIRLRLHGNRLPKDYTITMRLPSNNNISQRPAARRRENKPTARSRRPSHTSDSDNAPPTTVNVDQDEVPVDDLDTDSEEDAQTRTQNAYPGSHNTIGSIHQRRWFALLDRQSSGFESVGGKWTRRLLPNGEQGGFEPFVVRGREVEKSVVTGRLARDVESDEGCWGYVGRGGWKSIED